MKLTMALLNLPWSVLALLASILSIPTKFKFNSSELAIIISIKSFWWYTWLPKQKGARAMAMGNVILLSPHILVGDLEHELVHIKQYRREPLIHLFLYWMQTLRHGYRNNKYEIEAYDIAGNSYLGEEEVIK